MAFKTITIDVEVYELLKARKRPGQSFSAVIREGLRHGGTARDLLAAVAGCQVSDATLAELDRIVALRSDDPARPPVL